MHLVQGAYETTTIGASAADLGVVLAAYRLISRKAKLHQARTLNKATEP